MSLLFRTNKRSAADYDGSAIATVHSPWASPDGGKPLSPLPTASEIYATQPSVRKVVEFVAKNVARVQVQAFKGHQNGTREKLPADHKLSRLIVHPNDTTTWYRLVHDLVCDWLIYDRFLCLYSPDGRLTRQEPEAWAFHPISGTMSAVDGWQSVVAPQSQQVYMAFSDDTKGYPWFDKGYGDAQGISPMQTLRQTLEEHRESVQWRRELWRNGLRMPGYWTQDLKEAPLSHDARRRLEEELANYTENGGKEGKSPILRGIDYQTLQTPFTPQAAQEVEGRTLSDIEVASAYGVPPEMVGARQSNYSSQQAFRDALYRETLGSLFTQLQDSFNLQICYRAPEFKDCFVEFNLDSALRGSFLDDAKVTGSAVGGPWLSVNEARVSHGYEPLGDEYNEILTALNTVRGGGTQANPYDSGSQNIGGSDLG